MVRLYSRLLEETIVCVEDEPRTGETGEETEGRVLYTRSEVEALQGLGPDAIRAVHQTKKNFGGTYIGPAPKR